MFDVAGRAEHRGNGIARLAGNALAQRHAHIVHATGGGRAAHSHRLAHGVLQHGPDRGLGLGRAQLRRVGEAEPGTADRHGLEQRVAPHGYGGQVKHWVAFQQPVVADVFAVGTFGFDQAALIDVALQNQLGVSRNVDVHRDRLDHGQ